MLQRIQRHSAVCESVKSLAAFYDETIKRYRQQLEDIIERYQSQTTGLANWDFSKKAASKLVKDQQNLLIDLEDVSFETEIRLLDLKQDIIEIKHNYSLIERRAAVAQALHKSIDEERTENSARMLTDMASMEKEHDVLQLHLKEAQTRIYSSVQEMTLKDKQISELSIRVAELRRSCKDIEQLRLTECEDYQRKLHSVGEQMAFEHSIEQEALAAERERQQVVDRALTAESERQELVSTALAAESEWQQVEGRALAGKRERQEVEGRALAAERERQEVEGRVLAAERERQEVEGRALAADRERQEVEGRSLAAEREQQEVEGGALAAERERQEVVGGVLAAERERQKVEGGALTVESEWQELVSTALAAESEWQEVEGRNLAADRERQEVKGRALAAERGRQEEVSKALAAERERQEASGRSVTVMLLKHARQCSDLAVVLGQQQAGRSQRIQEFPNRDGDNEDDDCSRLLGSHGSRSGDESLDGCEKATGVTTGQDKIIRIRGSRMNENDQDGWDHVAATVLAVQDRPRRSVEGGGAAVEARKSSRSELKRPHPQVVDSEKPLIKKVRLLPEFDQESNLPTARHSSECVEYCNTDGNRNSCFNVSCTEIAKKVVIRSSLFSQEKKSSSKMKFNLKDTEALSAAAAAAAAAVVAREETTHKSGRFVADTAETAEVTETEPKFTSCGACWIDCVIVASTTNGPLIETKVESREESREFLKFFQEELVFLDKWSQKYLLCWAAESNQVKNFSQSVQLLIKDGGVHIAERFKRSDVMLLKDDDMLEGTVRSLEFDCGGGSVQTIEVMVRLSIAQGEYKASIIATHNDKLTLRLFNCAMFTYDLSNKMPGFSGDNRFTVVAVKYNRNDDDTVRVLASLKVLW